MGFWWNWNTKKPNEVIEASISVKIVKKICGTQLQEICTLCQEKNICVVRSSADNIG